MRLKRRLNRTVGDKPYYRWVLTGLSPATVDALGWSEGDELYTSVERGVLVVRKGK